MGSFLKQGLSWLADQMEANCSEPITYSRGVNSVAINATLGQSLLRVTDNQGNTRTVRTDRDFILRAADLVLNGSAIQPAAGDKIDVILSGVSQRYEVMPVGSEPSWRYSDPEQLMYRIHTKRIGPTP